MNIEIPKIIKDNFNSILFYILCWIIAAVVLINSVNRIDLDKPKEINLIFPVLILTGIIFLLLPFFKKVKFGKYFELERDVKEAKKELAEFKNEIRQYLSIITTNINTIGNLTNQVTINFPGIDDLKEEILTLKQQLSPDKEEDAEEVKQELILEDEDNIIALVRIRVQIEYLLRKILNKRVSIESLDKEIKYMGLNRLISEFFKYYPKYKYLSKSFDYVRRLGNAAAHAQRISEGQAKEALELGAHLIAVLKDIENNN